MELYIRPQFFNLIGAVPTTSMPNIDIENREIFTELHKYNNFPIVSKFKEMRYIPLSGGNLDYESNCWDFSQYTLLTNAHDRFHFESCVEIFKDDLKDYVLLRILSSNIKISTLYSELVILRHFFNYLAGTGLYRIDGIEDSDVEKYFISLNISATTFIKRQKVIKEFLKLYDAEHKTEVLTPGIEELCKRMDPSKLKAIVKAARRKSIPDDFYNKLLSKLIHIMHDENELSKKRGLAAMLVIDSQTGLRASELSLLEANSIEEVDIDGKIAKMIKYKIVKSVRGGNNEYINAITYINDISFEAYKVATEVFSENRKNRNTNYLCCFPEAKLPVDTDSYRNFMKEVCIKYNKELGSTNEKLKGTLSGEMSKSSFILDIARNNKELQATVNDFPDNQVFYYPLVHQYRNTVVVGLLRRGVKLEFVRRYMGHLSEEMTAAYAESYDTDMQENLAVSESTLSTIISGEAKLLGPSADRLTAGINAWIESHQLNVATDMDEIIEGLEKVVPIRAKRGGVCIKGSKLTNACSVDVQTDEFMCAVGLCSNICHFYFNADESYADYKEAMATYTFNKENGFTRQAEKEYTKVTYILRNRLGPEMVELVKEIKQIGEQEVLKRHPNLEEVLNNIEEIKEIVDGYTEEEFS